MSVCEVLVHLPQVGPVNRSLRCDGRSRLMFRDGRPCGDRYEYRHHKNRREDKSDLMRFRCHLPLLGPDSEFGLYRLDRGEICDARHALVE